MEMNSLTKMLFNVSNKTYTKLVVFNSYLKSTKTTIQRNQYSRRMVTPQRKYWSL